MRISLGRVSRRVNSVGFPKIGARVAGFAVPSGMRRTHGQEVSDPSPDRHTQPVATGPVLGDTSCRSVHPRPLRSRPRDFAFPRVGLPHSWRGSPLVECIPHCQSSGLCPSAGGEPPVRCDSGSGSTWDRAGDAPGGPASGLGWSRAHRSGVG